VLVTNIAPQATEKTVSEFFSFCGKIVRLVMRNGSGTGGTHEAVVSFETEAAAKTALLLTNALIVDRPIMVTPYSPPASLVGDLPQPGETVTSGDQIQQKQFTVPDDERSKTSVIASMIASGYVLAHDATQKAKEYDDAYNISLQLKVGAEELKKKMLEVDNQYQISATAASYTQAATEKIKSLDQQYGVSATLAQKSKELDEQYQISKRTSDAGAALAATWANVAAGSRDLINRTMQQPYVANTTAQLTEQYSAIEKESKDLIDQKLRAQQQQQAAAGVTTIAPTAAAAGSAENVAQPSAAVDGGASISTPPVVAAAAAASPVASPAPSAPNAKQA